MTALVLTQVILLLAVLQPTRERLAVALSYALVNAGHLVLVSWWIDGYAYYLTAALADVAIMGLVLRSVRIPTIGISLLRVCIAEILLNCAGWLMWWSYMEPAAYNTVYLGLQVWVVLILTRKDQADELGGYTVVGRTDILRHFFGSRHPHL